MIAFSSVIAAACSSSPEQAGVDASQPVADGAALDAPTLNVAPIAIGDFCAELIDAGCDYGARCGSLPADRAQCRTQLADLWDACPFFPQAVERSETGYNATEARKLVEATRVLACIMSPSLDPVNTFAVFTPRRQSGETCISKVSCVAGLSCSGTVSAPEGVCEPT